MQHLHISPQLPFHWPNQVSGSDPQAGLQGRGLQAAATDPAANFLKKYIVNDNNFSSMDNFWTMPQSSECGKPFTFPVASINSNVFIGSFVFYIGEQSSSQHLLMLAFFPLLQRIRDLEDKTDIQKRQIKDLEEKVCVKFNMYVLQPFFFFRWENTLSFAHCTFFALSYFVPG